MVNIGVYREVKAWKKPLHVSRAQLAKAYLKLLPNLEIIGITGSVGKTLTQNAIYSVLSQKFKTVVGDENLDPTFRIPQTILKAKPWDQKLILEYGIEHPGDMDHYLSVVKPKIAVVTAITPTHTKYLGSIEGVFKEKVKLVEALLKDNWAVLNTDDPYCRQMVSKTSARVLWYGQRAKDGVKISHFSQSLAGSRFRLHYHTQKGTVVWKIVGKHQLTSAYAAAAVGIICGLTLKQIAKGLSAVKAPEHRLNSIATKNINILDDTYNSSPQAAVEAIKTLVALGRGKKKVAVLGEMKDLGDLSDEAHQKLGKVIAAYKINYLLTIGKVAAKIAKACKKADFSDGVVTVGNTAEALKTLKKLINPKTLVLVKGSRHAHLERVVLGLLNHPTQVSCYHCGLVG